MPNWNGTKTSFLACADVISFSDWLADVICGKVNIDYVLTENTRFDRLSCARGAYRWPPRKIVLPLPTGAVVLPRWSGLRENEDVLQLLADGLREALKKRPRNEEALAEWIKAIFIWGGVYTKRGNGAWLESMRGRLGPYLDRTLSSLGNAEQRRDIEQLTDLRSNAGTTKLHSLALDDFVIYDSRVAAALAWLVVKWACAANRNSIPPMLRFGCMRPNTTDRGKVRTPDRRLFHYFAPVAGNLNSQRTHAFWNLCANWLLRAALDKAGRKCGSDSNFRSLRDVEAGLFVMGADLSHAIPSVRACIERYAVNAKTKGKISTWRIEELRPESPKRATQEDVADKLDNMMHGDHRFWNPPRKKE